MVRHRTNKLFLWSLLVIQEYRKKKKKKLPCKCWYPTSSYFPAFPRRRLGCCRLLLMSCCCCGACWSLGQESRTQEHNHTLKTFVNVETLHRWKHIHTVPHCSIKWFWYENPSKMSWFISITIKAKHAQKRDRVNRGRLQFFFSGSRLRTFLMSLLKVPHFIDVEPFWPSVHSQYLDNHLTGLFYGRRKNCSGER